MNEEKNFKLIIAEQYLKGELPILERKDTFNFTCVQCGECCRNRGDILLNPLDIFRLCKEKQMEPQALFQKYCEIYPGKDTKLPLVRVQFRPVYALGSDKVIGTRCPFLGKKDGLHFCRVHKSKPFVCFSYPLGRVQKQAEKAEYVLQTDIHCAGAMKAKADGTMQQVEAWMFGKERLDIEEAFNNIFSGFLDSFYKWINLDKLSGSKDLLPIYKKWFGLTGELLYCNYDFDADEKSFLEQLRKNISMIEEMCTFVVNEFSGIADLRSKYK